MPLVYPDPATDLPSADGAVLALNNGSRAVNASTVNNPQRAWGTSNRVPHPAGRPPSWRLGRPDRRAGDRTAGAPQRAAHERADEGLRQLVKRGEPVTFASVAAAAGVSKDFLYRTRDLRDRIEQLRLQQTPHDPGRASSLSNRHGEVSSVVRTLTLKLTQERAQHRREAADLRAALAAVHGELLLRKRRGAITDR